MNTEKLLPPGEPVAQQGVLQGAPSPKAQSWGTILSIMVIVLMIVIGAFYAWGQRIAEERAILAPASVN